MGVPRCEKPSVSLSLVAVGPSVQTFNEFGSAVFITPEILYNIVLYALHFLPVNFFPKYYFKVDGSSFQVFWICKLWKERTESQLNVITKFVYDSIAKLVVVQKRQLFCHQLLPWQRYLMIVQTYFWASKAHTLKTNLVTPISFTLVSLSFENETTWSYKKNFYVKKGSLSIMKNSFRRNF